MDVLQYGLVPVAHTMVSPVQPEFAHVQASIVRYDYDLRRSAQIIEGMGYTKAADGIYRDAAGQRLGVEIRSTGGDDFRDKMLFTIADEWKRTGIDAEPVIIPRQRANDREYRVTRPAVEMANQPSELRGLIRFHSRELPTPENSFRGDNRSRYISPVLDGLIDQFTITVPFPDRIRVLGQIVRHMTENLVVLDLHYSGEVGASAKRLRNIPVGDPWNSQEWEAS